MGPDENYSTALLFLLYTGLSSDSKEDFQRRHSTPVSDVIRLFLHYTHEYMSSDSYARRKYERYRARSLFRRTYNDALLSLETLFE